MFFEEAKALSVTMKMRKMSQKEMAKSLGVSQSYVANKLRLLTIEKEMQKQIRDNKLTERHARALLRLNSNEDRQKILNRVCEEKLSVARTEALVDLLHLSESPETAECGEKLKIIYAFEEKIKKHLSLLNSLGIRTTYKTTHENGRLFISICIDENQDF